MKMGGSKGEMKIGASKAGNWRLAKGRPETGDWRKYGWKMKIEGKKDDK